MKKGNVGQALKELRGDQTQLELSLEVGVCRETISAYETERAKIPPDISRKLVKMKDDAWFVMALRHQYTGTGPLRLDGEKVDLHRASVKDSVMEELEEASEAIRKVKLANKLKFLSAWEKNELIESLVQLVDVITGIEHFLAVICEEAEISYRGVWEKHYKKLISRGYASKDQLNGVEL
ncbi:helix-turn-helix domain-containing protein [Pseudobacillus wudalianchiensis]|nr:helix-turn-helix transcriptional regulator [Bacillus wudalianchiensis]